MVTIDKIHCLALRAAECGDLLVLSVCNMATVIDEIRKRPTSLDARQHPIEDLKELEAHVHLVIERWLAAEP